MKLPGDSDNMDKGVSHEMMQRSLQSQRRVVKRVGLLEDKVEQLESVENRVDDLENTEIEPDTRLGDLADGAKKVAKGIGKSIGKNAALLADKAGKGLAKAGKSAATAAGKGIKSAADATGKGIKKGVKGAVDATGKGIKKGVKGAVDATGKGIKNVGKGISDFIKDKAKLKKSIGKDKPKSKDDKDKPDKDQTTSGSENVKPPTPTTQPLDDLVPDPIAAHSKDKDGNTIYDVNERVRQFFESQGKPVPAKYAKASDSPKVESLENVNASEDDAVDKVKKDLSDEFEVDEKMKKAFSDALALPAKSAAVAMTDLLEKIPAPSKEASKILNRNISKLAAAFNLGAASAEVANDEEDNDSEQEGEKRPRWQVMLGNLIGKAFKSNNTAEEGGGGGGQPMLPPAAGDPSYGRRAPFTGTADGIGLGDPKSGERSMQPIKKRKSLARKLFNMTPMGMAFNAGTKIFQGAKGLAGKAAGSGLGKGLKGLAGKAFGMTPMGMGLKLGMKAFGGIKNIFAPKDEQTTNLTELTDKVIQENRESADAKTEKQVALAAGVVAGGDTPPPAPSPQEGSELAQPEIIDSPYLDVYNHTSQF
jgi:hypothetical protein